MVLSVRSRNAARTLALLKCSRELLADIDFRRQITQTFDKASFDESKEYLQALQNGGVDFLGDFAPVMEDGTMMYFATPIWGALLTKSEGVFDWIVLTSKARDLSSYPASYLTRIVKDVSISPAETQSRYPFVLKVIRLLVERGVKRDSNDYEPFRIAKFVALDTQYPTGISDSMEAARNWTVRLSQGSGAQEYRKAAPFWAGIAEVLAPADKTVLATTTRKAVEAFAPSRIRIYDGELRSLNALLEGGGIRRINDEEILVDKSRLQDGDLVRDNTLRSVDGMYYYATVGNVRKLIAETQIERSKYVALLSQVGN
jgi:hypothetical protein